jgi:dihydropteroate synthase
LPSPDLADSPLLLPAAGGILAAMAADPQLMDSQRTWTLPTRHALAFRRPSEVMGIINVTPDSFSDGGVHLDADLAVAAGLRMAQAGAAWIDVGGESSRPGAAPVPLERECERVLPVVERLASALSQLHPQVQVSIDTTKPEVARRALRAGARLVNDITGARDPAMLEVVAAAGAPLVIMHMQGTPQTMQRAPHYQDLLGEIESFFEERLKAAESAGVSRAMCLLDPGIGFGKTLVQNVQLLRSLPRLSRAFDRPLVVGISRKSFIAKLIGLPAQAQADTRDAPSHILHALLARECSLMRVHDVPGAVMACRLSGALTGEWSRHV